MGYEGFDEKIDVIDLIINVLREHEKKLDELVSRLEEANVVGATREAGEGEKSRVGALLPRVTATAELRSWTEFTERCSGARLVAYEVDSERFKVSALAGGLVYTYVEEIPCMEFRYSEVEGKARITSIDVGKIEELLAALRGRLDCGLELDRRTVETDLPDGGRVQKVFYDINPSVARSWVTFQLGVEEGSVVQGELNV